MQFDPLKRREFITLIGGAAAWPLAAHAQQRERKRRIGALMAYTANDPQAQIRNAAFLQGLLQLGWIVGQNVQIDYRWSGGNIDDTRRSAAELVALTPDVIFAPGSSALGPLLQGSRSVPIVFAMNDRQRAPGHDQATVWAAREGRNRTFDLTSVGHVDGASFASRQRIGLTPP